MAVAKASKNKATNDVSSKIADLYKTLPGEPLDYSFMEILVMTEEKKDQKATSAAVVPTTAQADSESDSPKKKKRPQPKVCTTAVKLNNNHLKDLKDFQTVMNDILEEPSELNWLDLSFNDFGIIDKVLTDYPKLRTIYLHGNRIDKLSEIDKLAKLPELRSLALHGNPIEGMKGYRQYVLAKLPNLKSLDFCTVTNQDRHHAESYQKLVIDNKRKKPEPAK
eukprot:Colp12_sorted_trinity150504_noHs@33881